MCHSFFNPATPTSQVLPFDLRAITAKRGNCNPQSILFLTSGSDHVPQTTVMAFRERLIHACSLKTLMQALSLWQMSRPVRAKPGDCLFACVFSLYSGINIYYMEKQNRRDCLCSLPLPPDDLLYSCVMDFAQ